MAENLYAPPAAKVADTDEADSTLWVASRTQRFFTLVIDYFFIMLFGGIFGFVLGALGAGGFLRHPSALQSNLFGVAVMTLFYLLFEGLFSRTPGKWICGTRVVDRDGERPGFGRIVGRSLARFVPFEPLSFFGSNAVGWHDSLSGTRVVRTRGTGKVLFEDSFD